MKTKLTSTMALAKTLKDRQANGQPATLGEHADLLTKQVNDYKKQAADDTKAAASEPDPTNKKVMLDSVAQLNTHIQALQDHLNTNVHPKVPQETQEQKDVDDHKQNVAPLEEFHKQKTTAEKAKKIATKVDGKVADATGYAQTCTNAFFNNIPPTFCWKKGGDVGIIPTGCPADHFRYLALCFKNCKPGYSFDGGAMCKKGCPSGYHSYAATCTLWKKLKTISRDPYFDSSITNFEAPCNPGYYRGGALCYRDCANIGQVNCGIGMCASSKDSCAAGIVSMVTNVLISIAQGVGFVLSFGTSSAATAGVDTAKAALKKLGTKGLKMIEQGVMTIKRIATNPTVRKKFLDGMIKKALDKAKDSAVNEAETKLLTTVCQSVGDKLMDVQAAKASSGFHFNIDDLDVIGIGNIKSSCTGVSDTNGGIACAQSVVNTISTVDPTGLMGLASAFMQPICDV